MDATGRTAGTLFSLRPRERWHQTLSAIVLPYQVIPGQWNGVAHGSRARENAEEVPRRLDWREGQRGIEELVGRLIVDGKFVVRVWPPADRVHRLAAEGCGRCLPPHRGQGRCGGKNRVTASPLHIKTRVRRHGHDVKDGMSGIWRKAFGALSICGDHSGFKVQRT
jgi:hypothetical protein